MTLQVLTTCRPGPLNLPNGLSAVVGCGGVCIETEDILNYVFWDKKWRLRKCPIDCMNTVGEEQK